MGVITGVIEYLFSECVTLLETECFRWNKWSFLSENLAFPVL